MSRRIASLLAVVILHALFAPLVLAAETVRVPAERVCMVQDRLFPTPQIPVELEGKTYYGCCPMCAGQLREDVSLRMATDPVTGQPVDKSSAITAANPDGSILYFESEETFGQFVGGQ
ncbi:MAG: hypothetical protein M5U32_11850 [Myxococcota bacterium]|nr:hypothetical protein [Myxococcota bacterium]